MDGSEALSQLIYPGASLFIFAGLLKIIYVAQGWTSPDDADEPDIAIIRLSNKKPFVFLVAVLEVFIGTSIFLNFQSTLFGFVQLTLFISFTLWIFYGFSKGMNSCKCFGAAKSQPPNLFNVLRNFAMVVFTAISLIAGLQQINWLGFLLSFVSIILIYITEIK